MKKLLIFTGAAEAATGVALMVVPALVGRLLLGAELAGVAVVVARVAGIALLALGIGCWPGPASLGMLTYNALATVYFAWLALGREWVGPLLWPAAGLHAVLAILLGRAWLRSLKTGGRNNQTGEQ
ncbi:MAG: hypothetical protein ACLQAH_04640 [Limisphaerales bacterium]